MARYRFAASILLCLWPPAMNAQEKAAAGKLPVKRVILFKNGVGYFEHVGKVHGNESVTVSFTSGQLNDVLKSLTVLDLNGGRISGVAYGTSAPVDRQLGDLRLPISEKTTLTELLGALRGARIEARTGSATVSGRLLSVERKTRVANGVSTDIDYVSLISENGELRTAELSPAASVRLLEPGLAGTVDRYLNLISSEREADVRNMVISTEGSGDRELSVSYISEVPVWKSTYRLVLDSRTGKSPLLQGWAIVDNVVGEDWNNVELSLVAGAPQSFIQNLSQPYYAHRPTISLPDTVSTTPQTYQATLTHGSAQLSGAVTDPAGAGIASAVVKALDGASNLVAQVNTNGQGEYEIPSLPDGPFRLEIEAPGFAVNRVEGLVASTGNQFQQNVQLQLGNAAQTVQLAADPKALPNLGRAAFMGSGSSLGSGRGIGGKLQSGSGGGAGGGVFHSLADTAIAASSQPLGDLFEYKLKDPITIVKNRSALVPIAQSAIAADKVSVWNEKSGVPRPLRALWVTNTTGLTLDGGSVSVLEDDSFSGEGIFDAIRPGEKRLLSYATDLAVNASAKGGSEPKRVSHVIIDKGAMVQESEIREKKTYTFRNEDTKPRSIVVEHPVRSGYQLKSEPRPVETTADYMRFRLEVQPKETASLVVEEVRPLESRFLLTNISSEQVALFVSQRSIDDGIQKALREVLAQKDAISELEQQKNSRQEERQRIFDDQQRLRENIKALKGTPEEKPLLQRYTQQLNDQETRLAVLQKESEQLDARIDEANAKLEATIQKLSFDVKF